MAHSLLSETGVVVIGAGVAGLAAARRLRARGVPTTLIEAGPRLGGRAHTIGLASGPFDLGATWLHDADRNPLVGLAVPEDCLVAVDAMRQERLSQAGRPLSASEHAACDALWERLDAVVAPALAGPDRPLAEALAPLEGEPFAPLVHLWEGPIIAAAETARLGLQDWWRNRLGGRNLVPAQGVGAFVAARLATEAVTGCAATGVNWSGPGVAVETPQGSLRAGACVVTVSTGVLASGAIRFDPPLPLAVEAAIHALPMGLLNKIAFGFAGEIPVGTVMADVEGSMTMIVGFMGRPSLVGFAGGATAWATDGDAAAFEALARGELRRVLGAEAGRVGAIQAMSGWGHDPLVRGAYAYAGPGDHLARDTLADAFPGERLVFAGEAVRTDGLAGTVGGAWLSGVAAADRLMGPPA